MARDSEIVDLLVIGGGTAGIVGSTTAASLGARTVLVESSRTGGDCLWTGCVPSKTILSAAAASAGKGRSPATAQILPTSANASPEPSPRSNRTIHRKPSPPRVSPSSQAAPVSLALGKPTWTAGPFAFVRHLSPLVRRLRFPLYQASTSRPRLSLQKPFGTWKPFLDGW